MARPKNTLPSRQLAHILRALVPWFVAHQTSLAEELGEELPLQHAAATADDLERAEAALLLERKEDKDVTARRAEHLEAAAIFYRSLRASVERAARKLPVPSRVIDDFHFESLRNLRSPGAMLHAFTRASTALDLHRDALAAAPRAAGWPAEIARLSGALKEVTDAAVTEAHETRQAQDHRDALRARSLAIIDDVYLAAQAVESLDPAPLVAIKALISAYSGA